MFTFYTIFLKDQTDSNFEHTLSEYLRKHEQGYQKR